MSNKHTKWAYGITTVPERINTYLPKTLESLALAGFDIPRLFVDGLQDVSIYNRFKLNITNRWPRIRTVGNWVLGAWELLFRNPNATHYAIFEDDLVTYPNLRQYLELVPCPTKGYCNLFTNPNNQVLKSHNDFYGWYESNQQGQGAVGLVFTHEALDVLLSSRQFTLQVHEKNNRNLDVIDGGVVEAMHNAGWKEYVHSPSLVQHKGNISALKHGKFPPSDWFCGESFNVMDLLEDIKSNNE